MFRSSLHTLIFKRLPPNRQVHGTKDVMTFSEKSVWRLRARRSESQARSAMIALIATSNRKDIHQQTFTSESLDK